MSVVAPPADQLRAPGNFLATADHLPGLDPHHVRELRASGLTDETIRAAGIYSEHNHHKVAAMLNRKSWAQKSATGIVYRFLRPDSSHECSRFKPDVPRRRDGKPVKYESPAGQPNPIYLPPGVAAILDNPAVELVITEGEKKALKVNQEGVACIGLVGVWGWKRSKKSESLSVALEQVTWQGRRVTIIYDSDGATNDDVVGAADRLAMHLGRRGAVVRIAYVPAGPDGDGKVGVDDYLATAADPVRALRELIDNAGEPGIVTGADAKANSGDIDPETEARALLESQQADGMNRIAYHRGNWLRWSEGSYQEVSPDEIETATLRHLAAGYSKLGQTPVRNVSAHVRAQASLASRIEAPAWLGQPPRDWPAHELLATRSQIVHLPSIGTGADHVIPATPRLFVTSALDFSYDATAPVPEYWLAFLRQLWPADPGAIELLQEWFGYALTSDTSQQKILLMVGPKRSGKGTIARVLTSLIGNKNVTSPSLTQLSTPFGLWPLLGKSLGIFHDARFGAGRDQKVVVERLLSISGEDAQTVDRKFLPPVTVTLPTRLMIVSNELPQLTDASGALSSRLLVLRMERSFLGKEDRGLFKKLQGELPGILLWAIEGWQRLRQRGHFLQPDSGHELAACFDRLSSPVGQFLADCCTVKPDCQVSPADLFGAWQTWCRRQGEYQPGTNATFGRDLAAAAPAVQRIRLRLDDGSRPWVYRGVGLLDCSQSEAA